MLYPSDINYAPFTDAQIAAFAQFAGIEYAGDLRWRDDLDDAARELIIGHFSQQWASPSAIIKELRLIAKNPDRFFKRITRGADDHRDAFVDSVDTSLRHGTGWTDDQLIDAVHHRAEFVAGIEKEVIFLGKIQRHNRAKLDAAGRRRESKPDTAMIEFVNRLAVVYQDAFLNGANDGLTYAYATSRTSIKSKDGCVSGPFIKFSKAVLGAVNENLSAAVRREAPCLPTMLTRMALVSDTSLWKRFERSDYYEQIRGNRKA